jgi:hypothetical protein
MSLRMIASFVYMWAQMALGPLGRHCGTRRSRRAIVS